MAAIDLNSLSIEEKIGQLFFIGVPGPDFDEATRTLIQDIKPGGVCLFARNIKELRQTRDLLDSIHNALRVSPLLSLDQEGGRVDRLRRIMTPMPAANLLRNVDDAATLGEIAGESLGLLGFNMNFAPVVDVIDDGRRDLVNGLQSRGLGKNKEEVVEMAAAFLDGMRQFKIFGCLKHFPGLAAAQVDSHEELPVVSISDDELENNDLFPYRQLFARSADVSVMIAHAAFSNTRLQESDVNGNLIPSSLNARIVTSLLRDDLNFKGVAITDDMEMGAIVRNYGMGAACVMAVAAGEDMLAICASEDAIREGHRAITDAIDAGKISEERIDQSIERIADLKFRLGNRAEFDPSGFKLLNERIQELNNHLN